MHKKTLKFMIIALANLVVTQAHKASAVPEISFLTAAAQGDIDVLRAHIAAGVDINQVDDKGYSALALAACAFEGTRCLNFLLKTRGIAVNKADMDGITPLIHAVYCGYTDKVRLLLTAREIDVNYITNRGQTPLIAAVSNERTEIVRLLLDAPGIDVNQTDFDYCSPLLIAVYYRKTEIIKLLLSARGIDLNLADINKMTPLMMATCNGDTELVRLLLRDRRVRINQAEINGMSALMLAATGGHHQCMQILLGVEGIGVNQTDNYGMTALMGAVRNGHIQCVRLLCDAGVDISQTEHGGRTALMLALSGGSNNRVVSALLRAGATVGDLRSDNPEINQLLEWARANDMEQIRAYDIEHGGSAVDPMTPKTLMRAARAGDLDAVRKHVAAGIQVNYVDQGGWNALMEAAAGRDVEIVRFLIGVRGIDVNIRSRDGKTALSRAAERGYLAVVQALLLGGATCDNLKTGYLHVNKLLNWALENNMEAIRQYDVDRFDNKCSIWEAAASGDTDEIQAHITAGTDINLIGGYFNTTPLMEALAHNKVDAVQAILQAPGIDVNCVDLRGDTALIRAGGLCLESVRLLLAAPDIKVNVVDREGKTALAHLFDYGSFVISGQYLSALLRAGATVGDLRSDNPEINQLLEWARANDMDRIIAYDIAHGGAPCPARARTIESAINLLDAASDGNLARVQEYVAAGVDLNEQREGMTALIAAAYHGRAQVMRVLLDARAQVNAANSEGSTALMIAAQVARRDVLQVLLDAPGVEIDCADRYGNTPLSRAVQGGSGAVVSALLRAGACARDLTSENPEVNQLLEWSRSGSIGHIEGYDFAHRIQGESK